MQPIGEPASIPARPEGNPRGGNTWFTRLLLVGLTLTLTVSLCANVWRHRLMSEYSARAVAARADLASEELFAPDNAALAPPDPRSIRMVFAGDSDVELWEPLPEVKGCEIIQRGFGGDRTGDLLVRLERDVIELKPAVAVLTIGGNDLEDIGLFPDQEEALVAICQRNIRVILDRLRQRRIQVVLLTIFPYGEVELEQWPVWSKAIYRAVERVNAMLRGLAGPGVLVVDCDPILAQANGRRKSTYTSDMVHLNTTGYQAINQALLPVLESLANQARPQVDK